MICGLEIQTEPLLRNNYAVHSTFKMFFRRRERSSSSPAFIYLFFFLENRIKLPDIQKHRRSVSEDWHQQKLMDGAYFVSTGWSGNENPLVAGSPFPPSLAACSRVLSRDYLLAKNYRKKKNRKPARKLGEELNGKMKSAWRAMKAFRPLSIIVSSPSREKFTTLFSENQT